MFSYLATPSSYSEKLKIFHVCSEYSLWDQDSYITFGKSLEFCLPQSLSLVSVSNNDRFHGLWWE